jgi:hypothetical protein
MAEAEARGDKVRKSVRPADALALPPEPGARVRAFFRWFDLWIGVYIDRGERAIYICPIPMFGIRISY